jgi:tetratricopeptide (TPR) repeat protein
LPGSTVPTINRAYLLGRSGDLARQQADFAAAAALIQGSLAIHEELGGKWGELHCCRSLADVARDQGDYARARPFDERQMALARELESEHEIARALDGMGYTAYLEGDLGTAQALLEESLQLLRKGEEVAWARTRPSPADDDPYIYGAGIEHLMELAWACEHQGEVADARGEYGTARACLEESVVIFREFGFLRHAFQALYKLGRVARHEGRWSQATTHYCESLAFWWQDGDKQRAAACLDGLAAVGSGQGEPERATRLLGAAAALRESRGIPLPSIERADLDGVLAAVRAGLSEEALGAAWACGQSTPLEELIALALQEALAG